MIEQEISDYKKLKAVKYKIAEQPLLKTALKSIYYCGSKVPVIKGQARVALMANDKVARFIGNSTCKSAWACPVCTARQMAKYGSKIASAIDALKQQGLVAAMLTFTIPHTSGFTCYQATEILYNTWKAFTVHGNGKQQTNKNDIFAKFMGEFQSKHRVRVCEYTWGKAGWHPHFHCLFWFPKNRINEILEWEKALNERWLELTKRYTIREFLLGYPESQRKTVRAKIETRVRIMYEKMDTAGSNGVYISKENNKVIIQESSAYLTGWGADSELTGNVQNKATHIGHYSWQQILERALAADKRKGCDYSAPIDSLLASLSSKEQNADLLKNSDHLTPETISNNDQVTSILNELQPAEGSRKKEVRVGDEQEPDWWKLYFEYALATRKQRHARINFSVHSGICQIIAAYRQTEGYKTFLKKNRTQLEEKFGRWKMVCCFTLAQWRKICERDLEPVLLFLATANDANKLIEELLRKYQIPPPIKNETEAEKLEMIWNAA